jgi:hypothetical protein
MDSINTSRLVVAGLSAGIALFVIDGLVNGVLLAEQWAAYQKSIGKSGEFSGGQMAAFTFLDVIAGLALAWLYAAIRPRFGPGPATALRAGFVTWLLLSIPSAFMVATQVMPAGLTAISVGYALAQYLLVGLLAGYLYKEAGAVAVMRAGA